MKNFFLFLYLSVLVISFLAFLLEYLNGEIIWSFLILCLFLGVIIIKQSLEKLSLQKQIKLLKKEKADLSFQMQIQEKMLFLQSRQASIGELVGNISHQWKEPLGGLGAILSNLHASVLVEGKISNNKLIDSIEQSYKIIHHLSNTISVFYRFFRNKKSDKSEFSILEEIQNIQTMLNYSMKSDRIDFLFDCADTLFLNGDRNEFANALINILLNAKDILSERQVEKPWIKVNVKKSENNIIITIEDNGGGIKQEPIEKIFDYTVSSKEESTGIGLFIVKNIIKKRMKGKINVQNSMHGSLFTIVIPIILKENEKNGDLSYDIEESAYDRIVRLERELTKQKEVEKALRDWEDIFKQTNWGITVHKGVSSYFELINPAFCKMYGYREEEIKTKVISDFFAPQSLELLDQKQKEAFEKSFASFEAIHIKRDGSKFPVNIDITVIKNENSDILYHIFNVRDTTETKEAQKELLLKTFALNHVHEAFYLVNEHSKIQDLNDGACRALGYTKEELLQLHITDIDPEWPKERWPEHWEELKQKKTLIVETHHMRKDGTIFPVEVEANYFEYNGVSYNLGLVRDISERKEIEKKKEDEKMRLFFERQLVGMAITSPTKGWLHVNNKLCEMLGYSANELKNMTWSEVTHPDDLKGDITLFEKMLRGEIEHYFYEKRYIKKDGSITFANLSIGCVREENGSVDYLIVLIEDITERKKVMEALQKSEEEFRTLVENANDNIARYDCEARIAYINPQLEKTLGITLDEIKGESPKERNKNGLYDEYENILQEVLQTGQNRTFDFVLSLDNGEKLFHHIKLIAEKNSSGKVIGALAIGRDVTERKKTEDQIKALNTTLEQRVQARTKELWEKEREVRTLAENMPDFLARYDKECKRMYVNKAVSDYFGVAAKELVGTTPGNKPLIGVPKTFQEKVYEVLNTKRTTELEAYNDLDGKRRWWNIIFTPEFDENGKLESVLSIAHDITSIKKAELEIKQREEKFSQLFQSSPAAVSLSSLDKNIYLDVNDSFLLYTQYTKEEVIGKGARELNIFAMPDDRERYLEKLLKDGFIRDFEFEYQTKDGTTGYAIAYASTIDIKGEKCVLAHSYPINTRKQLELITTAINSASEAIYIVASSSQMIIYVNAAACDMLGYTKEELLCMQIKDIDVSYRDKDLQHFENQANQGENVTIETQHKRKDGLIVDVEVKISAFQFNGKDVGISVVKDITDIKKTRFALQKKQKEFTEQLEHKVKQRTKELEKALKFNEDIINAIPDLMFEISKEGIYLNIWTRDENLLAEQKDILLGKNFKDVLPPDVVKIACKSMEEADKHGSSLGNIYKLNLPEGEHLFELHITIKEPDGNYLALSRDITARQL